MLHSLARLRQFLLPSLLVTTAGAIILPTLAPGGWFEASATTTAKKTTVLAWNDLGMHCEDDDYSVFSLLPPFNTIYAQVVRDGKLVENPTGLTVTYKAASDPDGSINKTSVGKTDFWQYVFDLFGVAPAPDTGLAGFSMPGTQNNPQAMTFDPALDAFVAEGIPVTPQDDAAETNTYPLFRVEVRDSIGQLLAKTRIVVPVSDEMDCRVCHASGSNPDAQPGSGWVNDPDPDRDHRLNILSLHDEYHGWEPTYATLLTAAGYNPAGLYQTVAVDQKPVLCVACHSSNALPGYGQPNVSPLTSAIHTLHAYVEDPVTGLDLNDAQNRSACYRCHPGSETRCLRGAMGKAVAGNGSLKMQCQDCHGSMSDVGSPARDGWLDEPTCQNCHTGTAVHNNGKIRYASAFDKQGKLRKAVNQTFATSPHTPAPGKSLFRFSRGHGGLFCAACHGSPHATYPSSHDSDNIQSVAVQGHVGTIAECTACHTSQPDTVTGGPHGMHPLGGDWLDEHDHKGKYQCRNCHGLDYKGTVLSGAFGERTFGAGDFGKQKYWRGYRVTCYTCHDGPDDDDDNNNHPAKVSNLSAKTDNETPVVLKLKATDQETKSSKLELRIVDQPKFGTVGLKDGKATYYPAAGFVGTEQFTYAAFDGKTDSNLAKAKVTIKDAVCAVSLSDPVEAFDVNGGSGMFLIAAPPECAWSASVDATAASWLGIAGGSTGTGQGNIGYVVAPSSSKQTRTGKITVNGEKHRVKQGGSESADLVGWFKDLKQECSGGSTDCGLVMIFRIKNMGGDTAGSSELHLYISADPLFDGGDVLFRSKHVSKLAPGKAWKKQFTAELPGGSSISGMYVLGVLDGDGSVPESDKTNNVVVFGPVP